MMKKIILIDHNSMTELYALNLRVFTGAEVITFSEVRRAIKHITSSIKSRPHVIVVRSIIRDVNAATILLNAQKQWTSSIPTLILGQAPIFGYDAVFLDEGFQLPDLTRSVAKILKVTPQEMVKLELPEYFPIPLKLFNSDLPAVCDGHVIPLKKSIEQMTESSRDNPEAEAEGQTLEFKLIFQKNEVISQALVAGLQQRGYKEIYVKSVHRIRILKDLNEQLVDALLKEELSIAERINITKKSQEIVSNALTEFGIDPHTIRLVDASIQSMNTLIDEIPSIQSLMEELTKNTLTYRYLHCVLISYISSKLIAKMDWGSSDQNLKVSFVAFFHDMVFKSDYLTRIHSEEEWKTANLTEKQRALTHTHALRAAKLVSLIPNAPFGVDTLVKQHHGTRTGIGYGPIANNISHLCIIFMVAEEWADYTLKNINNQDPLLYKKFINLMMNKYGEIKSFKNVVMALTYIHY